MSRQPENRSDLWLKRRIWDAQRFGVTSRGISHRLGFGKEPRIVITSIPKAGTHMVERLLCLHPGLSRMISGTVMGAQKLQQERLARLLKRQRPGQVICGHIHHTPTIVDLVRRHDAKVVFVVRDPRDVVVSTAHYIRKLKRHPLRDLALELPELDDRIRMLIEGTDRPDEPGIDRRLRIYAGWLNDAEAVARYEELVDPARQIEATEKMLGDLGVSFTPAILERITSQVVSPVSVTFRSGTSGGWQSKINEDLLERFNEKAGESSRLYGYP